MNSTDVANLRGKLDIIYKTLLQTTRTVELLQPLLDDRSLFNKWDGEEGSIATGYIRNVLFMSSLNDFRKIVLDRRKDVASLHGIRKDLGNCEIVNELRIGYTSPPVALDPEGFNEQLKLSKKLYDELVVNELSKRIEKARHKLVSHIAIDNPEEPNTAYSPGDIGLTRTDVKDFYNQIVPIVRSMYLVICFVDVDNDSFQEEAARSAIKFWYT